MNNKAAKCVNLILDGKDKISTVKQNEKTAKKELEEIMKKRGVTILETEFATVTYTVAMDKKTGNPKTKKVFDKKAFKEEMPDIYKQYWLKNPDFDIEKTETYEEYKNELQIFSNATKTAWKQINEIDLNTKAALLGIPGNTVLTQYILLLEARVREIETKLSTI
ncbi:MAG: hypothetical protein WC725_04685 [Patescibacteria group bacterium]|jgi:hypothetical protein